MSSQVALLEASLAAAPDPGSMEQIVLNLENAWNAGDGIRFAREFAEDSDFVTVYGLHATGRRKIAQGHDAIFRTVYAGSTIRYKIANLRYLAEDIAIAHLRAHLHVPAGPLAGDHDAVSSLTLVNEQGCWRIAAMHNTLASDPRGRPTQ
jgi:uncharacterized protein (TIGR02246 family)